MKTDVLREVISDALLSLEAARDELRDLDAAIGDGDLGITVTSGARAVRETFKTLPDDVAVADLLRASAKQFGAANPSTFAALISGGLLAASKEVPGVIEVDAEVSLRILQALFDSIKMRGKANLGDKTILDAMHPALQLLQEHLNDGAEQILTGMIEVVEQSIKDSAPLMSQRGRAAWVGERTMGHADGGATAFLRFLEALNRALQHFNNKEFAEKEA
jgi:dihydroxyacetone kinase-like protein